MIVGIDFDGTFTLDPQLWRTFIGESVARGHTCIVVTGRSDDGHWGEEVRREVGDLVPIVFAANRWKRAAALAAGYAVDVFVDDCPEYVAPQDPNQCVGRASG